MTRKFKKKIVYVGISSVFAHPAHSPSPVVCRWSEHLDGHQHGGPRHGAVHGVFLRQELIDAYRLTQMNLPDVSEPCLSTSTNSFGS